MHLCKIMKLKPKGKPSTPPIIDDEPFYEEVAKELKSDAMKPGLWTKAVAEAEGGQEKVKSIYIRLRVAQLRAAKEAELRELQRLEDERIKAEEEAAKKEAARQEAELRELQRLENERIRAEEEAAKQEAAREKAAKLEAAKLERQQKAEGRKHKKAEKKKRVDNTNFGPVVLSIMVFFGIVTTWWVIISPLLLVVLFPIYCIEIWYFRERSAWKKRNAEELNLQDLD